jgi:Tfp pilus assembly protein FimV
MSVATEFEVLVPVPVPVPGVSRPDAPVLHLHPPSTAPFATPIRLTRRGVVVVSAAVGLVCAALVLLAWHSAPAPARQAPVPATVTVRGGDTLWAIASRVAPDRDPRQEVARLRQLNGLDDVELAVGQVLRAR